MSDKNNQIHVFCSISKKEVGKVEAYLIPSLEKQIGVGKIKLTLINYVGEGSLYQKKLNGEKIDIEEISNNKKMGFGESHNFAFNEVKPSNFFVVVNPDAYLNKNCLSEMMKNFQKKSTGIVEARQLPFEHPKEYDKKTGETPWASGACVLINSDFFSEAGGFDLNYWMYCEDVDLSWRAWLKGYKVIYVPGAVVYHFTGGHFSYNETRFYLEHFWSGRNFLYIAYKFFGHSGEKKAIRLLNSVNYPEKLKAEIIKSYFDLKENKKTQPPSREVSNKINKMSDKIKIISYNQYHELS